MFYPLKVKKKKSFCFGSWENVWSGHVRLAIKEVYLEDSARIQTIKLSLEKTWVPMSQTDSEAITSWVYLKFEIFSFNVLVKFYPSFSCELLKYQSVTTILLAWYSEQINLERVSSFKIEGPSKWKQREEGAEMFRVSWSSSVTVWKYLKSFMEMPYQGLTVSGALSKTLLEDPGESHSCWDW